MVFGLVRKTRGFLDWLPWDSCHHTPVTVGPQGARACIGLTGRAGEVGEKWREGEGCMRCPALGSADRPARTLYRRA